MHRSAIEVGLKPSRCPIHELVGNNDGARPQIRSQTPRRAWREDPSNPEAAKCPHVGSIGHCVSWELVLLAVASYERGQSSPDFTNADRRTWGAVGGIEFNLERVIVEE